MEHAGWIVSFRVLVLDGLGNESLSPGIGAGHENQMKDRPMLLRGRLDPRP